MFLSSTLNGYARLPVVAIRALAGICLLNSTAGPLLDLPVRVHDPRRGAARGAGAASGLTPSADQVEADRDRHPNGLEGGLPEADEDFATQTAATACEQAGIAFDPASDGVRYAVEEVDSEKYGVLEIDAQRYARASLLAAGAVFFIVGLALGVTALSVWLLAAGHGGFIAYLWIRGPARQGREGWLFAVGLTVLMSWVAGFVVRGVVF